VPGDDRAEVLGTIAAFGREVISSEVIA